MPTKNALFYGDNLTILPLHVPDQSVDLVYLDPPFNSNQDYNAFFIEQDGTASTAQASAFEDTWEWGPDAERLYTHVVENGPTRVSQTLQGLRKFLSETKMMAYLAEMAPRLLQLHRVLKTTGSIYLHCDATASAYLRILMDSIFGPANFRNEIVWYYYNKMHDRRKKMFARAHDTILFYVKDVNSGFTYHQLKEMREKPIKQLARKKVDGKMVNAKDKDGHVIYRMKDDRTLDNVWRLPCLQPAAPERLGYPTQKPESVLDRIILASSNEGDVILDPFCGCGTAIIAAQRLNRRWIGIDVTSLATLLIKTRLRDSFPNTESSYQIVGEPTTLSEAQYLANNDQYQFQWWALGLVGARPIEEKKGADRGVDGRLFFHDDAKGKETKQIMFSVKAGNLTPAYVRDLGHVVEREKAAMGVLLTMNEPTGPMKKEATTAGYYTSPTGTKHPKLQILTVGDILNGKTVNMPAWREVLTFKRAPKAKIHTEEQLDMFDAETDE